MGNLRDRTTASLGTPSSEPTTPPLPSKMCMYLQALGSFSPLIPGMPVWSLRCRSDLLGQTHLTRLCGQALAGFMGGYLGPGLSLNKPNKLSLGLSGEPSAPAVC